MLYPSLVLIPWRQFFKRAKFHIEMRLLVLTMIELHGAGPYLTLLRAAQHFIFFFGAGVGGVKITAGLGDSAAPSDEIDRSFPLEFKSDPLDNSSFFAGSSHRALVLGKTKEKPILRAVRPSMHHPGNTNPNLEMAGPER